MKECKHGISGEPCPDCIKEYIVEQHDRRSELFRVRIEQLAKVYGSIRAVGRALKIDHVYLHRLANGEKQNPSKVVLRKLGLSD